MKNQGKHIEYGYGADERWHVYLQTQDPEGRVDERGNPAQKRMMKIYSEQKRH
jgi:hypothetical protein